MCSWVYLSLWGTTERFRRRADRIRQAPNEEGKAMLDATVGAGGGPCEIEYEPADLLDDLKRRDAERPQSGLPERLLVETIKRLPALFQPRGLDENERHVQHLVGEIKKDGELDPVTVIQIGPDVILVDGHHRLAAYEQAGYSEPISVHYFQGSIEDAVLEAGRANSKTKLPMNTQERQNYAWRLVLIGAYSKRQVKDAAGVSDGQVAIMRRVKKQLGTDATTYDNWWHAQRIVKRGQPDDRDDDIDAWKEAQANHYADRLAKEFGRKLATHPELAAMAFNIYFGRKLPDLYDELESFVPDRVGMPATEDDF
jgi:hypothetical protein